MFRLGTRNWPPVSHDLGQALTLLLSHFTKSLRHSMPHSNAQPHGGGIALDSIRMPAVLAPHQGNLCIRIGAVKAIIEVACAYRPIRCILSRSNDEWRGSANARGRFECRFQKTLT